MPGLLARPISADTSPGGLVTMTGRLRRTWRLTLALAGVLAAASPAPAQTSPNRGLIWKIERAGQTGWLVGSLHLLTADAYPLPPALDAAFASADVLVEEADPAE